MLIRELYAVLEQSEQDIPPQTRIVTTQQLSCVCHIACRRSQSAKTRSQRADCMFCLYPLIPFTRDYSDCCAVKALCCKDSTHT